MAQAGEGPASDSGQSAPNEKIHRRIQANRLGGKASAMSVYGSAPVLLLEDEPLIALDIEEVLNEAGFHEVNIISSCSAAEGWLRANTPAVVVLDIHLRDGPSTAIASSLVDRAIPFVVHSGETLQASDSYAVFSKGRWVSKPCLLDDLVLAVRTCVSGH